MTSSPVSSRTRSGSSLDHALLDGSLRLVLDLDRVPTELVWLVPERVSRSWPHYLLTELLVVFLLFSDRLPVVSLICLCGRPHGI